MESVQSRQGMGQRGIGGGFRSVGGGRADKGKVKKAVNELQEIQAPMREVNNTVNLGIVTEAFKTQVFTTPAQAAQQ